MTERIRINAVAFEEGGAWVVQGIEYDIAAHAADPEGLPAAFMRAVVETAFISQHLGRQPLAGVKAAPRRFREMFEHASSRPMTSDIRLDDARADVSIRLAVA